MTALPWIELRIQLDRQHGPPRIAARRTFESLAAFLLDQGADDGVRRISFQRKPPDIRLRVETGPDPEPTHARLAAILDALRPEPVVSWHTVLYEPEVYKFGGGAGIDAVHHHFDRDTRRWWEIELTRTTPIEIESFSAEVACCLEIEMLLAAGAALGLDPDEQGDVWYNLGVLACAAPLGEELVATTPEYRSDTVSRLLPDLADSALETAREDGTALGADLAKLHADGALLVGPRAILAHVAQFDFQRWGLDGSWQRTVAQAYLTGGAPHSSLRGVTP